MKAPKATIVDKAAESDDKIFINGKFEGLGLGLDTTYDWLIVDDGSEYPILLRLKK